MNTQQRTSAEDRARAATPEAQEVFVGFHGLLSSGLNELVARTATNFVARRLICRPDVHFRGHQHFGSIAIAKDLIVTEIFVDGQRVLEGLNIRPSESRRSGAYELPLDRLPAGTEIRLRLANFAAVPFEFFATLQGELW